MTEPRYGCPECGGERIRECNMVMQDIDVIAWEEDGTPADYGSDQVFWDLATVNDPAYICRDCENTFNEPKRLEAEA